MSHTSKRYLGVDRQPTRVSNVRPGRALLFALVLGAAFLLLAAACGGGREDAAPPTQETEAPTPAPEESAQTPTVAEPPSADDATGTETDSSEQEAPDEAVPPPAQDADEAAEPPAADTVDVVDVAADDPALSAYVAAGCAACHGDHAEGTEIGPALPGHSSEVIMRQIRAPLGSMPAYGEDRLSDAQLDLIVEFIVALAPEAEHIEPLDLPGSLAVHPSCSSRLVEATSS